MPAAIYRRLESIEAEYAGRDRTGPRTADGESSQYSHLLADALTPMGVRPLWPLSSRRYTLAVVRAANPLANYALLGVGIAAVLADAGIVATLGCWGFE